MLPQQQRQHKKKQKKKKLIADVAIAPWRTTNTLGKQENETPRTGQTCKGETQQPLQPQSHSKNTKPHLLRTGKKGNEKRRKTKVPKRSKRAAESKWKHAKDQQGAYHQVPSRHSQLKKKKAAKNSSIGTHRSGNKPVEDTTKKSPHAASLREGRKNSKPQAEERKTEQSLPPRETDTTGSDTKDARCRSTRNKSQEKDNLRTTRALIRKEETPKLCPNHTQRVEDERKEAQKRTAKNEDRWTKLPRAKRRVHSLQNEGPKTEGPRPRTNQERKNTRQTSTPDKDKKGDIRERISKADRISAHMKKKEGRGGRTKNHRSLGTKKEGVQKQPK